MKPPAAPAAGKQPQRHSHCHEATSSKTVKAAHDFQASSVAAAREAVTRRRMVQPMAAAAAALEPAVAEGSSSAGATGPVSAATAKLLIRPPRHEPLTHLSAPFGDFPTAKEHRHPLLNIAQADFWLDSVQEVSSRGTYTYLLPFTGAATPYTTWAGGNVICLSGYSYAGLAGDSRTAAAGARALQHYGTSSSGARILTGTLDLHLQLEAALARFAGKQATITCCSGYDANLAAVSSLFGPKDIIFIDKDAHNSLFAGVALSGAKMQRFLHNNMSDLERKLKTTPPEARKLIIVDGVYSMSGEYCPLAELVALKKKYNAFLLLDESHALGAIGPTGRGSCEEQGVDPADVDIITCSLSKGFAASGGFVAVDRDVAVYLQHAAAQFFYSVALSPAMTAVALEAVQLFETEGLEIFTRVRENTQKLRRGLLERGFSTSTEGNSPIVPLFLGSSDRTQAWAAALLRDHGIYTSAVITPAVPPTTARLRLCANATHSDELYDRVFAALEAVRATEEWHGGLPTNLQ